MMTRTKEDEKRDDTNNFLLRFTINIYTNQCFYLDQRVVYNFLQDINRTQSKDLNNILDSLKKYLIFSQVHFVLLKRKTN